MTTTRKGFLHLLCGKMASGKSTLARELAASHCAVLLSEDVLLGHLYPGEIADISDYVRLSSRVKDAVRDHLVSVLEQGLVVVLDFPANTTAQRLWLLNIALDARVDHTLHYLECSDELCIARLPVRRQQQPERQGTDTEEMFRAVTKHFQPPNASEGLSIRPIIVQ